MPRWLERAASLRPDRLAVEAGDGALTYGELLRRARAVDVAPGAVVPLDASPSLDFVVGLHACLERGAVAVPIDPRLGPGERSSMVEGSDPLTRRIGAEQGDRPAASGRTDVAGSDPLVGVRTSGTTGEPALVWLSRANVLAQALGSAVALGLDRDERWLFPLPLSHVGGLMVLLRSAIYGTTAVLGPVDVDLVGITVASLVPTQLGRALDAGLERPSGLRAVLLGGAGAPHPLLERAAAAGVPVAQTYGLTQACSSVTVSEPGDLETQGAPLPGVDLTIAPDGEIVVNGPTVAGGGPLRTGDLGTLDARGRLIVTGRQADTIVTGGENVVPAHVEAVLLGHPDVTDAAVFGAPDAEWGEAVHARVVPREGATLDAQALRGFARERLAGFQAPKVIELTAEPLPRSVGGKLLRRELR